MAASTNPNDPTRTEQDIVAETLAKIETSWTGLMDALAGIPDDKLRERGAVGEWSIKDLMGHIAFWDDRAVINAARFNSGAPVDEEVDVQAANAREAAAGADRSLEEQRATMLRAHQAVVSTLETAPPSGNRVGLCGCLEGDTFEHYDEHADDVRLWRQEAGI